MILDGLKKRVYNENTKKGGKWIYELPHVIWGCILLALLSLRNYSVSAQRPIVAFTREYTWDIESKER